MHVLTGTKEAMEAPTRASACMLWLLARCFCGTPNSGNGRISDCFACFWTYFLLQVWLTQPCYEDLCLVLVYLDIISLANIPRRPALFWKETKEAFNDRESWEEWSGWKMRLGYIENNNDNNNKIIRKNKKKFWV